MDWNRESELFELDLDDSVRVSRGANPSESDSLLGRDRHSHLELDFETDPISEARLAAASAVDGAVERLKHALYTVRKGLPVPHDVEEAMDRFFTRTRHSGKQFQELIERIEPVSEWIKTVSARKVDSGASFPSTAQRCVIDALISCGTHSAFTFPAYLNAGKSKPFGSNFEPMIALLPRWFGQSAEPQALILLHETLHFSYEDIKEGKHKGTKSRWRNANAYVGLVATLGGLTLPSGFDRRLTAGAGEAAKGSCFSKAIKKC